MVELYWPNETTFLAPSGQYRGPGVHDVPDDREDEYRERGWEDPPADGDADTADESGGSGSEDTPAEPFDPGDHTVEELDRILDADDFSDDERKALVDAEWSGKDRSSAVEVLEP